MVPTPWMSRLLGPLSDTMSRVSVRDCALAGDHTAGAAGRAPPAASAVTDFRNSRRFIKTSMSGKPHVRADRPRERAAKVVPKQLVGRALAQSPASLAA